MAAATALAAVLAMPSMSPTPVAATAAPNPTALDGDCLALRSVATGHLVGRGALAGYQANGSGATERFRLQSTGEHHYLLYGDRGEFLAAALLSLVVLPAKAAGPAAQWRLDPSGDAYTIVSPAAGKQLAVAPLIGALILRDAGAGGDAGRFTLVPADGCAQAPEAGVNVTGEPFTGTTPDGEVRGLIDLHNHLTAFEFIGGRLHCGRPWSQYGITDALTDCPDHEPFGAGAWFENLVSDAYPSLTHDTTGWPTFRDWPKYNSLTHEGTYYKWLERAWRGGLRIFTNLFVNNSALCEIYPLKRNSCDDMDAVRLQSQRIHELQDYIDAQHGGPGQGWFRIVHDPAEARQVIEQGKLAVVLGIELSAPFGCSVRQGVPQCDQQDIDRGLDEVYSLGVRQMFVCHKFDNALCGVRFDEGTQGIVVNAGNAYTTGRFWEAETCTGDAHDNTIEFQADELAGPLRELLPPGVTLPVYPAAPHCNIHGLSQLGEYAIRGMMDRGMIVDVDHMSVRATEQALQLFEAAGYPGVVSSHSWLDASFYQRIYALGGFATPYGHGTDQFIGEWRRLRAAADPASPFGIGAGFDTNGLGRQPAPRAGNDANPVRYPFTSFDGGSTIDRQTTGQRAYDVNTDGFAHYGLWPDWLEDLRIAAGAEGERIVADMARGPEAYLQTWDRAIVHATAQRPTPVQPATRPAAR